VPVTETLMAVGQWSLTLKPDTPRSIIDSLSYFQHIVVATGRQDPRVAGNSLFSAGRYTGVLTGVDFQSLSQGRGPVLSGDGLATWLGTPKGVGPVIENTTLFTSANFATVINTLRPSTVGAGTNYTIAGSSYTGAFVWKTPRDALTSFCQQVSTGGLPTQTVEWRVNNNCTLDAGPVANLYRTTPACAIVAKSAGVDMTVRALAGVTQLIEDVKDYSTRVVVLANGSGAATAVGAANIADVGGTNPYTDFFGNPVKMTRMISASSVSSYNATAAAQSALIPYTTPADQVKLSSDEYDIKGQLQVGDYVYVYDPDAGLVDYSNEVVFRGQRINPTRQRVIELTWPLVEGMTVAYRDATGTWHDLTDYVQWETGSTNVVVGGYNRNLVPTSEPVGPRPIPDTTIPGIPVFGAFSTASYQSPSDGKTKAQIQVSWSTPANTDGTTITDGDHYEIQYRPDLGIFSTNPSYNALQTAGYTYNSLASLAGTYNQLIPQAVANWKVAYVAFGVNNLLVHELTPGVNYDFQIRCVDTAQPPNRGAWSATTTFQAAVDTVPPPAPDAPTVAANMASVQVTWDCGQAGGGTFNQASDLHHIEVHGSYDPLFQPSNLTKLGNVSANVGNITGQIPVVASFTIPPNQPPAQSMYIRIIAVDVTGNKSTPSAAAGATAVLWSNAYISDLSVSKLTAGTITASVILGSTISTAASGGRVVLDGGADAFEVYDTTGTQVANWSPGGLVITTNPGGGTLTISPNPGTLKSPSLDFFSGTAGVSSTPASIHSNVNSLGTVEGLVIAGPIATGDANASFTRVTLTNSTSGFNDAASGSLDFFDSTFAFGLSPLTWQRNGVDLDTLINNTGIFIAGAAVHTDENTSLGAPHIVRFQTVSSVTPNVNGDCTVSHNAAFTPTGCLIISAQQTSGPTQFGVGTITSTTINFRCYNPNGTAYTGAAFNIYLFVFG
jgi:hypothetical protein